MEGGGRPGFSAVVEGAWVSGGHSLVGYACDGRATSPM